MERNDPIKKRALVLSSILIMSLFIFLSANIPHATATPYLFEDNFETADLTKWTGKVEVDGVANITSTGYSGSYGLNATMITSGTGAALVYRQITPAQNILHVKACIKFNNLLTTNSRAARILLINNGISGSNLATAEIYRESGTVKWALQYRAGNTSNRISDSTLTVQTDTWYTVELKADLSTSEGTTDGSYAMWINENLILEATNIDTHWTLGDYVYVGRGRDWNTATEAGTHFLDNVIVDASYIGNRDIAVTNITTSKTVLGQGYLMSINVTVQNQGNIAPDPFNVTAYYDNNIIGTHLISSLLPEESITLTFIWDGTAIPKGDYAISAHAQVQDDSDTTNNILLGSTVRVTIPCDINGDGKVNAHDLFEMGKAYGATPTTPNWNPNCDLYEDGVIDTTELHDLIQNFGNIGQ